MNKIDPILNQDFSGAFNLYSGSDILSMGYSDSPKRLEHLRKKPLFSSECYPIPSEIHLFRWLLYRIPVNMATWKFPIHFPEKHWKSIHFPMGKTWKNPPFSQGLQDLGEGGRVSRQAAQHRLELGAEPSQARIRVVHAVHFSRRTCVERSGLNQLNEKIIAGIVI